MLKSLIAKYEINRFVKKYFPDSEKHAFNDAESRKQLKEKLSWFVDKQDYETLDFFLREGRNLGNINYFATHNFIHGSRELSKENMADLQYVVNKTKQELKNGNDIEVETMLDLFKNSQNKADLEEILIGSKELSQKMNTTPNSQHTNISPTFVKKYQENKTKLGEKNFSKLKTIVEEISKKNPDNAKKIFGLTSFLSLEGIDNTKNFSEEEITYVLDTVLDVKNSNNIGYYSNQEDAQKDLFETSTNFISYANNLLGIEKTENLFKRIMSFTKINVSSLEQIIRGIKKILSNNEKDDNETSYFLLEETVDVIKTIKTHPISKEMFCETYKTVKSDNIKEFQQIVTKAEKISNAIDSTTSQAFLTYKEIKDIYSQEFANKVLEYSISLSKKSKKIASKAFYLARELLKDKIFYTNTENSTENNKKEYSFQETEQQYEALIKTVDEIPEKYNNIALTVLSNGRFVARDYGYKGIKEIAESLCKIYEYGKGDNAFIAKMTQIATGKPKW